MCVERNVLEFPQGVYVYKVIILFLAHFISSIFPFYILCVLFGFSEDAAGADASLLVSLVLRRRTRLRKMRSVPLVFSFSGPVCDSFFYIFLLLTLGNIVTRMFAFKAVTRTAHNYST